MASVPADSRAISMDIIIIIIITAIGRTGRITASACFTAPAIGD
jgi:hypothetical protein